MQIKISYMIMYNRCEFKDNSICIKGHINQFCFQICSHPRSALEIRALLIMRENRCSKNRKYQNINQGHL